MCLSSVARPEILVHLSFVPVVPPDNGLTTETALGMFTRLHARHGRSLKLIRTPKHARTPPKAPWSALKHAFCP
eukprot:11463240-Alexandrium_andersonii.AAC.1